MINNKCVRRNKMKDQLEQKFEQAIEDAKFSFFEWQGFISKPKLALIAGMAIGYKIAIEQIEGKLK